MKKNKNDVIKRTYTIEADTIITTMNYSFYWNIQDRFGYDSEKAAEFTDQVRLTQGWVLTEQNLLEEEDDIYTFNLPSIPVFLVSKEDVNEEVV
jgi:hypothetical protein